MTVINICIWKLPFTYLIPFEDSDFVITTSDLLLGSDKYMDISPSIQKNFGLAGGAVAFWTCTSSSSVASWTTGSFNFDTPEKCLFCVLNDEVSVTF